MLRRDLRQLQCATIRAWRSGSKLVRHARELRRDTQLEALDCRRSAVAGTAQLSGAVR
jgi:hypothetical protein